MALAGLKPLQHVACFSTLDEYQSMARAEGNLLIALPGKRAAENMEKKLGQPYVSVFSVFRLEGIRSNYEAMESFLIVSLISKVMRMSLFCFLNPVGTVSEEKQL